MASEAARLHPIGDGRGFDDVTRSVLEAALDCIVVMATDGRVVEWNRAAEQTFGYAREEAGPPGSRAEIDMEFVRNIATSPADRRLVQSIVMIARGLGVRTVAEGVEDGAMLVLLREYGVDRAQGWHLGAPAPVAPA